MKLKTKILIGILVVLVGIQFISFREVGSVDPNKDLLSNVEGTAEMKALVKSACYDCHSNETVYPWYASIAPVSWIVDHDIEEGREHLNFSEWTDYDVEKADHKLEECVEEIEEGEMPLEAYIALHDEATLTEDQRNQLIEWFKSLRKKFH